MAYDLGALVTRLTVTGQAESERDINAVGTALAKSSKQGKDLGDALDNTDVISAKLTRQLVQMGDRGENALKALGVAMPVGAAEKLVRQIEAIQARYAGLEQFIPSTQSWGQKVRAVASEWTNLGERGRQALTQVGTGMTVAGLAIGALLGIAVAKYTEYDAAISRATAVTGAYGEELQSIRKLTIQLGGDTVFTAKEAAEGVTELGKAGLKTSDILGGGLAGSLNLAAAGELAVSDAAAITATSLTQFNLKGGQASHVADLLAAGSGKALGSVTDLGAALNQSGLVASQMGLSIEDTTGSLAAFASAGLIGSDAGTSFKTMLLNLATPTKQQSELLDQYNLSAYDAKGNFIGMTELARKLETNLAGLDQQQRDYTLGVIFGSDSIRAANVLYSEGAAGIADWIDKTDDAGYAARIAAVNVDNLAGDVEKLGGAMDSALIKTGAGADGALRSIVQTVTALVDGFSDLPPWMQQIILTGAALTAGLLLTGGAFSMGVVKAVEYRAALAILRADMPLTTAALGKLTTFLAGPWGIALVAAAAGVTILQGAADRLKASSDEMTGAVTTSNRTLESMWATAAKGSGGLVGVKANMDNIQKAADRLSGGANPFSFFFDSDLLQTSQVLKRLGDTLAEVAVTDLPTAQDGFRQLAKQTDGSEKSLIGLLENMPALKQAFIEQATATGVYSEVMTEAEKRTALLEFAQGIQEETTLSAADSYKVAAEEASGLSEQITELIDLINEANGVGQDAVSQNAEYQESLAGISAEIEAQRQAYIEANGTLDGFTASLDESTVSGSANSAMLAGVAADAQSAARAQYEVDVTTMGAKAATDKYLGTLAASREALVQQALANGFTAAEVQNLMDRVYALPSQKEIQILAETGNARGMIDGFINQQNGRRVSIYVDAVGGNPVYQVGGGGDGGVVRFFAQGGMRAPVSNAGAQAQIKRAGDVTVWAEHETGGESYIPWAEDRRERAEAILARTAQQFGGQYIPPGAKYAADGMVRGGEPAAVGSVVHVTKVYIGETELRVIAREEIDETLTTVTVEYGGGTNL